MAKSKQRAAKARNTAKAKNDQTKGVQSARPEAPRKGQDDGINKQKITPFTAFNRFRDFPFELRRMIWEGALVAEAKKRVVMFDDKSGAIMPTTQLASPFFVVNSESRDEAKTFYSVQIDVHACTRDLNHTAQYGTFRGVMRMNFDYDTLIVGVAPPPQSPAEEGEHDEDGLDRYDVRNLIGPDGSATQYPSSVPFNYITTRLTSAQYAQVKRIYEIEKSAMRVQSFMNPFWEPPCCWGCSYNDVVGGWDDEVNHSFSEESFPHVWLCRLFITSPAYSEHKLMLDYSYLEIEELHEVMRLKFVTCDEPPVRRLGADGWEPVVDVWEPYSENDMSE